MKTYCCECKSETSFDESGYCNRCGGHYDNVVRKYIDHVNYLKYNSKINLNTSGEVCKNLIEKYDVKFI